MFTKTENSLFYIIRLGIGHRASPPVTITDWEAVKALAAQHGLSAVALDGVYRLPENKRPEETFLAVWKGEVAQEFELIYEQYSKVLSQMSKFFASNGIKMMVFKGYACSLNWPMPNHRPCGDIDMWLFGKSREADELVASDRGIEVHYDYHHYTRFYWWKFRVENHYSFVNVHHHKSNVEMEKILEKLGEDDSYSVDVLGQKVCLPSPNLHALYLLRHAFTHFAAVKISLKHVLDWGFHVQAHSSEIDWPWLVGLLDSFGMHRMFNIFNAICVEDFGFAASLFPELRFSPMLKDRVLAEILSPEFSGETPSALFPRIAFKFRRWRANAWKHRLCYRESLWSAFWSGVWNHLLKPRSI